MCSRVTHNHAHSDPPEHNERELGKKHKPILVEYAEYRFSFSPGILRSPMRTSCNNAD